MADKNNFSKQDLHNLVATLVVDVMELKTEIKDIKQHFNSDKESSGMMLSEIRNEIKAAINSNKKPELSNLIKQLDSEEIEVFIYCLAVKIYESMVKWANKKANSNRAEGVLTMGDIIERMWGGQTDFIDQYNKDREIFLALKSPDSKIEDKVSKSLLAKITTQIKPFYNSKFSRWIKNPYKATAILMLAIYFSLSCFSWVKWHHYRSENIRLQKIEAKYEVDKAIIQELNPQLSITLSGYEKLTDEIGEDETLDFFTAKINELKECNTNETVF